MTDLRLIPMTGKDSDPAFGFVFAGMRDSLRHRSELDDEQYYKLVGAEIAASLKDPATRTQILTYDDPECSGEFIGFIVTRLNELIYIYVKAAYRGDGLGRYMLQTVTPIKYARYQANDEWYTEALKRRGIVIVIPEVIAA
jgi:GNAT superfamily N-acetyltransferase